MTANRTPRALETRATEIREVYVPPSALPDPTPQDGWAFRWVATHVLGNAEHRNVSMRMREGWVPVKAEDHPEMVSMHSEKGNVESGGLMLCKMPVEKVKAREAYFNGMASSQMQSVDNTFMKENDSRMPLFTERKSETSRGAKFGSGS